MMIVQKNRFSLFNLLGLLGVFLWVTVIFFREAPGIDYPGIRFWLGIAPNFGAALLLPVLFANYFPVLFKRPLTRLHFSYGLAGVFAALFFSEVIHAVFLNSMFDIWDLAASLIGLVIMGLIVR